MPAKLEVMALGHPNRSGNRFNTAAANPTPAQIREAREGAELTNTEFGALAYKSERIAEDWQSGERRMPPDTWELIQVKLAARRLLKSGRIAPADVRNLGLQLPQE